MAENRTFVMPMLDLQGTLIDLPYNEDLLALRSELDKIVQKKRGDWGLEGPGYTVEYDLEKEWYPIFITTSADLAYVIMNLIVTEKW